MITVKVFDRNMNKAIIKLKSILVNEGLFKELKDRKYYAKPSRKKKLKREESAKQRQRDLKREIKSLERDELSYF